MSLRTKADGLLGPRGVCFVAFRLIVNVLLLSAGVFGQAVDSKASGSASAGFVASIDVREIGSGCRVDVAALAVEGGGVSQSLHPLLDNQKIRILEVLDSHLIAVESSRGREVVRLLGVRGTFPGFPEAVNRYLREVARHEINVYLCSSDEWVEGSEFWFY